MRSARTTLPLLLSWLTSWFHGAVPAAPTLTATAAATPRGIFPPLPTITLTGNAVGQFCGRCSSEEITDYLAGLD